MDREQLKAAVKADIITKEQAIQMEKQLHLDGDGQGEGESLRFISNLNDIFLTLGIGLLFLGIVAASGILAAGLVGWKNYVPFVGTISAVSAWFMAEYFCTRRKMLLPSILLALIFSISIALIATSVAGWMRIGDVSASSVTGSIFQNEGTGLIKGALGETKETFLIGCLAAGLAAFAFYVRFRLPFTMAIMAGAVTAALTVVFFGQQILLFSGLICLVAAIVFDARDPQRLTRQSDNGFWLHVAAAPQIVYGLKATLGLDQGTEGSLTMVVLMAGLTFLSLLLNRRALILSGLMSFGFAVWSLFQIFGDGFLMKVAGPLLFLGGFIVLLGGGWRTARRSVLAFIPATGLLGRIIPPESSVND